MNRARPGLSLVEVLIAVLMLGISVTTLFSLQGVLSRGVFTAHALIDRIPYIRSFFVEIDRDQLFKRETVKSKTIEHPSLRMNYSIGAVADKSLTALKQLRLEKIEAEWPTPFGVKKETVARLRFVPQPEASQ
ncbi:hypothetical protein H0X06_05470 [Candidatus Dependentiae bacterium]|nr:hypothetical protein [Candidatus Dependentiae bacterium]